MIQLTQREKYYSIGAAILLLIFFLCQFLIFPALDNQKKMARLVKEKGADLQHIQAMRSRYLTLTGSGDNADSRAKGQAISDNPMSLFSVIENIAKSTNLSGKIDYMQPIFSEGVQGEDEIAVEVRMNSLQMKEVIGFLSSLQRQINVKRFDLRRNNRDLLELIITLSVKKKG